MGSESKLKLGDRVEATHGPEKKRGKITQINPSASKWPYQVTFLDGHEEIFHEGELTLLGDRPVPSEDVVEALIKINKQINKLRKKQRSLEIIRDVLERFV